MAKKRVNKKSKKVAGRNPSDKGKESKVRKLIRLAKARLLKRNPAKQKKKKGH